MLGCGSTSAHQRRRHIFERVGVSVALVGARRRTVLRSHPEPGDPGSIISLFKGGLTTEQTDLADLFRGQNTTSVLIRPSEPDQRSLIGSLLPLLGPDWIEMVCEPGGSKEGCREGVCEGFGERSNGENVSISEVVEMGAVRNAREYTLKCEMTWIRSRRAICHHISQAHRTFQLLSDRTMSFNRDERAIQSSAVPKPMNQPSVATV